MAYNTENTFVALIDQNGLIRDMSAGRRGEIVGCDYQREEEYKQTIAEMQETLDNYFGKLVELGAIEIPKSPEAIAQEAAEEQLRMAQEQAKQQAEINQALLGAIEKLSNKVEELEANGRTRHDNQRADEPSDGQYECDSQGDGTVAKPSKSRITAGTKAIA